MQTWLSSTALVRRLRKILQECPTLLDGISVGRALVSIVALAAVYGCASQRAAIEPESSLQRQLGFIRSGDTSRDYVETRLGAPVSVYESGRVVSYSLYWHDDRFMLDETPGSECYGLVIAYGADDRIARHGLVRMGSSRCRR